MKHLIGLIVLILCNTYTNELLAVSRDAFIEGLRPETCHRSVENIYFDPNKTEFDMAHALSLSWVAIQTLDLDSSHFNDDPDADLVNAEQNWGMRNIRMIDNRRFKVRAMVSDYEDAVFLTFRHTDSNLNWLLNADYGLWSFRHSFTFGEEVHHGFGMMLGSLWDEIVTEVRQRTANTNKKVVVFGHSLGGALALLAAPGLMIEGIEVSQVYSTGAPKVASERWTTFAKNLMGDTPIYRLTNRGDLFSRIPLVNETLDDFRYLFTFVPDFIADTFGRFRSNMEFGVIGEHFQVNDGGELIHDDEWGNIAEEEFYWQDMAEEFIEIDRTAPNIFANLLQKFAVVREKLDLHLMRKENNGYTCAMMDALLAE